jgi:vacuolar-type H+-ATPase subunit I/STV1
MAREALVVPFFLKETNDELIARLKDFEALVRADERNRTWTQEHWTDYERSIAAAEREKVLKEIADAKSNETNR